MLNQTKTRLLEKLDGWDQLKFVSPSDSANQKKQQLLEMAKNGEPRPNRKCHFGKALYSYVYALSGCYDAEFYKQIRKLRPDWFVTQFDIADQKKQQLLEMARNGEARPIHGKHPLAGCLYKYILADPLFKQKIENLRPDWLIDPVAENKRIIIQMAKNGEPRPIIGHHPMARFLVRYTDKTQAYYYEDFDEEIRSLRPDWFIDTRHKILEMAKNGDPRPSRRNHPLGGMLIKWTSKKSKCYDPKFDKQIRKLRPDWFKAC